tara:strand:- start:45 stop:1019 length:975 start_codon:yes stop_codon:yes gene_type:complete
MSKHIIKPLLGKGKKVLANGADVLASNGKNGSVVQSYVNQQRALAKANTSTSVQKEVFIEPTVKPIDEAVDNHLYRRRDTVNVAMPLDELETTLLKSLKEVGVTGVDITQPIRRSGPLGDATTLYRNYGQAWQKSGRAQKESLYAELDGERFFTDVKDKKTGRLAIRNVRDKLDESIRTGSARDIAIAEQTLNEADLRRWHRTLKTQRGWEAHHLNMIKLISNIVNGMDLNGRTAIYRHLGRRYNLFTGNSVFNKINLPPDIHDFVHAEMDRIGINYRKINFNKNTPLKKRLKYIKQYAKKMDQLQEFIYKQMSQRPSVASRLN